ncbi:MAG: ABC transporter permease [Acidobacteria bacterium]|nr:ABC transporter permease [Acidobacteriota bacterium]MBV9147619.1 ABC transporter permease [Acidobacteriota bacterium]MBV9436846.1 ABC transporter permease [Acidobacteriota bacterium]
MTIGVSSLRYAFRRLRRSPGFAISAILTLALGIGANTAIFSTVNTLLLRPYAFPELNRLVLLRESSHKQPGEQRVAAADFLDWQRQSKTFDQFAAFRFGSFNMGVEGDVAAVEGYTVSPNLQSMIGGQPLLGRTFLPEEGQEGKNSVAVLSHTTWRDRFGSAADVIGKTITINGRNTTIIGVMPAGFHYPLGAEIWMPMALSPADAVDREARSLYVLARLKSGISMKAADAELQAINARIQQQYPATNSARDISLLRLREEQYSYTAPMFLVLQAAALFVLLLACANLLNLMLAQAVTRTREIAVRNALGASKAHLARLFTGESLLISLLALAIAVSVSIAAVTAIRNGMPYGMTKWIAGWSEIHVDSRVLWVAGALALALAVLFAIGLTAFGSKVNLNRALKESGGATTGDRRLHRALAGLVVVQIVLSVVLLAGAGSAIHSFFSLQELYRGFNPDNLLVLEISLPKRDYSQPSKIVGFYDNAVRSARALPGVAYATVAANLPASNVESERVRFEITGQTSLRPEEMPSADLQVASADFLRALQIPLLQGRFISESDGRESAPIAVISQTMARKFWPSGGAIGQSLQLGVNSAPATIVGVVADVKLNWFDPEMRPTIYVPYTQRPRNSMRLLLRQSGGGSTLPNAIRQAVQRVDSNVVLNDPHPFTREIADSLAPIRIVGWLMMVFGGVALTLSTIGVYAVLAHRVARRTREFGLRLAMGATSEDLLQLILRESLKLAGTGLLIGIPLAIAVNIFGASQLFGLNGLNASMLLAFAAGILLVSAAAGFFPARRAMRCDPGEALRYE